MKNIYLTFIFTSVLTLNLFSQDVIGLKKNRIQYEVYKGVLSVNPYTIEGIIKPELDSLIKSNDRLVSDLSQKDSLMVFFGVIYSFPAKYKADKTRIPNYYYKFVVSLKDRKMKQCILFENTDEPCQENIPKNELEYKVRYYFDRYVGFTIKE